MILDLVFRLKEGEMLNDILPVLHIICTHMLTVKPVELSALGTIETGSLIFDFFKVQVLFF